MRVSSSWILLCAVPGGGQCGSAPCWREKGAAGFRYARKDGAPEGVAAVGIRAGEAGRPAVVFKGRGIHLSGRPGALPGLPLATPLRAQLRGSAEFCVEGEFGAVGVVENDAAKGLFKARGTP